MTGKNFSINRQRLADTFMSLVRIDSPSREEAAVAKWIKKNFEAFRGCRACFDNSMESTGSQCGNLIIHIDGDVDAPPLFFNAHMDTVEPGRGIIPVFDGTVFRTDGSTVLGSDDKAAIAILFEVVRCLREQEISHGPIDIVFTVCEEIGLLGAKALDISLLRAKAGYALDTTDPDTLINRAPEAVRLVIDVTGRAAHAGINPEEGINAIQVAARALAGISLGRIDHETTANIGTIHGGKATNIVPEVVRMEGEVRSHDSAMLRKVQDRIAGAFLRAADEYRTEKARSGHQGTPEPPFVQTEVFHDYPAMSVPEDHPLTAAAKRAAESAGRKLRVETTGGGSDANILNSKGLDTLILGIGMQNVHTTSEFILLEDMVRTARLTAGIILEWCRGD
jgi:tripeptide aminopeptidase